MASRPDEAAKLHKRAAEYHRERDEAEEVIYHLLSAEDYSGVATIVQEIGPDLLKQGRLDSLSTWIGQLPPETRAAFPAMDRLMGDCMRLRAHFDEALELYMSSQSHSTTAGDRLARSRALRGQAQVYLDTVRPLRAESLLEEALQLMEPQEHREESADLLSQMAENKLNLGLPAEAEALYHEAKLLRTVPVPGDIYLEARSMVRTGRLSQGRHLLQARAADERKAERKRPQRFHRETVLLLSLICSLQGDGSGAERYAREGIAIGRRLGSPFVEAVGLMRLGHALQLGPRLPWDALRLEHIVRCYEQAIEMVQTFKVMRTQVEPLWGLCRAYGYAGDPDRAEEYALEALEFAQRAGDEWVSNLVRVTTGASLAKAGRHGPAESWLKTAADGMSTVGDGYALTAARLWLAMNAWLSGDEKRATDRFAELAPLLVDQERHSLVVRRTHLGLDDPQAVVPLLMAAAGHADQVELASDLLRRMEQPAVEFHPGYTLHVRTLGPFEVYCGGAKVTASAWKREKARQVFQLLLTNRGRWLHREQIVDRLWPHMKPEAALRDFKVALSTMNRALEPARPRSASPYYLARRGESYSLNGQAELAVDADIFQELASGDSLDSLRLALDLYEDDYLVDSLYEDWPLARRRELRGQWISAAERLTQQCLDEDNVVEAIQICQRILARDRTVESLYQLLMKAYAAQGNSNQIHAVYKRCVQILREDLDVAPSSATVRLYESLS